MIKRFITFALATVVFGVCLLAPVANVSAVDVIDPKLCNGAVNPDIICNDRLPDKSESNPLFGPEGILTKSISILSIVTTVIATIVIIIAGIRFATSQNNNQTIISARNQIIYAMVGIVVAVIAQGLVIFVLKKLGT